MTRLTTIRYEQREAAFKAFNDAQNGPDKHSALMEYNRLDTLYQKEQADLADRADMQDFEDRISPPIDEPEES